MLATVYKGVGLPPKMERVPLPKIQEPTDAIIRVHKTTICGTDLHILKGNVPQTAPGRVLGHEGIGIIVEAGAAVKKYKVGDRILVNCITACGLCDACRDGKHANCARGGWQFGTLIDGMQAEYARVPHADYTGHKLPDDVAFDSPKEDAYVMASDVLPTSYEVGLRNGRFPKHAGTTIAVVGVGPLGLSAILCAATDGMHEDARIFAIDLNPQRLATAKTLGATHLILNDKGDAAQQVMAATDGKGADFVVECVGTPTGWDICQNIVAFGGEISILGVHGKPATLNLHKLWDRNVSIHTGIVHGETIPAFVDKIHSGAIHAEKLMSHEFSLGQIEHAYDFFENALETGALKVLIKNDLNSAPPNAKL